MRTVFSLAIAALVLTAPMAPERLHAQDAEEGEPANVSEAEVSTYIDVYGAMQADHDLAIEEALRRHGNGMDLAEFRDVERRIQRQDRLVERVRQALLDHARKRAGALPPEAQPTKRSDDQR